MKKLWPFFILMHGFSSIADDRISISVSQLLFETCRREFRHGLEEIPEVPTKPFEKREPRVLLPTEVDVWQEFFSPLVALIEAEWFVAKKVDDSFSVGLEPRRIAEDIAAKKNDFAVLSPFELVGLIGEGYSLRPVMWLESEKGSPSRHRSLLMKLRHHVTNGAIWVSYFRPASRLWARSNSWPKNVGQKFTSCHAGEFRNAEEALWGVIDKKISGAVISDEEWRYLKSLYPHFDSILAPVARSSQYPPALLVSGISERAIRLPEKYMDAARTWLGIKNPIPADWDSFHASSQEYRDLEWEVAPLVNLLGTVYLP